MTSARAAVVFALCITFAACGGSSPSEPEMGPVVFVQTVPAVVQAGATVELGFGLEVVEDIGSWEQGALTVSLPGIFERESAILLDVQADEARLTPASPSGGGFDAIVLRGPFALGDRLQVRLSVRVRADAPPGDHRIQMDGVAFNEVADQRVLELGIVRVPVGVGAP